MKVPGADAADRGAGPALDKIRALIQSQNHGAARDLLGQIHADALEDPGERYQLALIWLELGEFENAVTALRSAAQAAPDDAAVWNDLGCALNQLGDQTGALDAWKRASAARPFFPPALYNHALALEACGRLDEARSELETALGAHADLVPVLAALGRICAQSADTEAALRCYRRVIELEPDHFDAAYGAAGIELDRARFDQAAEGFARCIELDPDNVQARLKLALSLQELGRLDEALDNYRAILRRDPRRYYPVVKTLLSAARGVFWLDSKELRRQLMPR